MTEKYLFPHVFDTTRLPHIDELRRIGENAKDYWAGERARLDAIIVGWGTKSPGAPKKVQHHD